MKIFICNLILMVFFFGGYAQELDSILNLEVQETSIIVAETFKGTRIANGHSIETRKKGILDFLKRDIYPVFNHIKTSIWN